MKKNKIKSFFKYLYYFLTAKRYISKYYDKKIVNSRWFKSPYKNLGAEGWKWVVCSTKENIKNGKIFNAKFPVCGTSTVINGHNIFFDNDDLNIFQSPGCYFQAIGKIYIGKGSWVGLNVGFITSNHKIGDLDNHDLPKEIHIGPKCWIGMNSVILPGVILQEGTIVGANSLVNKSFFEKNVLIAGNPAKIIKKYGN